MANLVLDQDFAMEQIEQDASQIHEDVEAGHRQITIGKRLAAAARKKRWVGSAISFFSSEANVLLPSQLVGIRNFSRNHHRPRHRTRRHHPQLIAEWRGTRLTKQRVGLIGPAVYD